MGGVGDGEEVKRVKILSKKYDGSLRDEYETNLYAETDEALIVFSLPGTPYWDFRKNARFQAEDGLLEIYFKRRWFNVWHIAEQNSGINRAYINISLPITWREGIIEWVDLDLDYRVHMDGRVEKLDEDEFAQNALRYAYPPDVIAHAQAACREVEEGLALGAFPFDHKQQVALYEKIRREQTSVP